MNKEEILNKYIDLIDKGYCSDCNELNCIDNFFHAKITHAIRELQQENQSLKKENKILRENAEHNDKVVDKVNWENMLLKKENQDLKKQLENYKKLGFKYLQDKNNNLENQQKEFIEYLEDLIKQNETVVEVSKYGLPKNCSKLLIDFYKQILQKYKDIIGDVKNEN